MAIEIDPKTGAVIITPKDLEKQIPPKKPVVKKDEVKQDSKVELSKQLIDILTEYGGKESDIPVNHEYWDILGKFRATK